MSKFFLILLITLSFSAHAAIYEQIQNGVKVFSDSPENGGTEVKLPKESGFQEWHPNKRPEPPEPPEHIHEQETFHNERRIPVNVAVSPELQPGDMIRLLVDGKVYHEQEGNHFVLDNLSRGDHTLQAVVIGTDGSTLSTGKLLIHVKYHSQLFNRIKGNVPVVKPG